METAKSKINAIRKLLRGEKPDRPKKIWLIRNGKCTDPDYPHDVRDYDIQIEFVREIVKSSENELN